MIDPRGMEVLDWAHAVSLDLSGLLTVSVLERPEDWQRWALSVSTSPQISPYSPPDPRYFDSWRDWASRFVQAVPL